MSSARLCFIPILNPDGIYQGYNVVATVKRPHDEKREYYGALPSPEDLFILYRKWKYQYDALLDDGLRVDCGTVDDIEEGIISREILDNLSHQLMTKINEWLNLPHFLPVFNGMNCYFHQEDTIICILQSDDHKLLRLPLHLWSFFVRFPNAELIFSNFP